MNLEQQSFREITVTQRWWSRSNFSTLSLALVIKGKQQSPMQCCMDVLSELSGLYSRNLLLSCITAQYEWEPARCPWPSVVQYCPRVLTYSRLLTDFLHGHICCMPRLDLTILNMKAISMSSLSLKCKFTVLLISPTRKKEDLSLSAGAQQSNL